MTKGPETPSQTHSIVIDFMAMIRKIPLKKLDPPIRHCMTAIALTSIFTKAGDYSDEINVVFDNYMERKASRMERGICRRAKSKEIVVLDIISPNRNIPVILEKF